MADLALVFGWRPCDMHDMDLRELTAWRERARQRHEARTDP
jgi:glutathione S-transferase